MVGKVYITFLRPDGSVGHWNVPFDSLEYGFQTGTEKRPGLVL
jgi:hypothetical protein